MGKVEKVDIRVAEYLELAGREKWARVYASVNQGWTMTSNIAEYINYHLVVVESSTEYLYTVHDAGRHFIVCLKNKTCSCQMFQLEEIPYPHAWAVIKKKNLSADDYCSELFKPQTVVKTYDVAVDPLPDERE
ncbi:uncharacterized protein LOC132639669 [Lycium barbarum]|uniref:uncharacterized protein LOC132639669 n=1 Tax=Lycium barbarum TaxID=112863 RepID=UPI00293F1021|nr:uncharacterized protein LOC132639669 [Lycium barbarum]